MIDTSREPIAVVGLGLRFPGADDGFAFWELLSQGRDAFRPFPPERLRLAAFQEPGYTNKFRNGAPRGGYLNQIAQFDWRAFKIPPREADRLDPQQRLLLEVAHEALDDAGLLPNHSTNRRGGVFMGLSWNDFLRLQHGHPDHLDGYSALGNLFAFAANRLSFAFNFTGPSTSVDNACASSLVAVHLACQSLWSGESELALAGGVELILAPDSNLIIDKLEVLSDDRCRPMDAEADGFLRGEGAGVVVLKRLCDLTPQDRTYAVIRGSAVNHNGSGNWILQPNARAQAAVAEDALRIAGVSAEQIDYVELHGSAIPLGDQAEIEGLSRVYGKQRSVKVGSVKANIGSMGAAGGVAGLIKVALSLFHRQLPKMPHPTKPHPNLKLKERRFELCQTHRAWKSPAHGPPLAAVHTTSLSGTNGHLILQAHSRAIPPDSDLKPRSLLISADTAKGLRDQTRAYLGFLEKEARSSRSLDLAYATCVRRKHHSFRLAVFADRSKMASALNAFLNQKKDDSLFTAEQGQGPIPVLIALEDPDSKPDPLKLALFRRGIDSLADTFKAHTKLELRPCLADTVALNKKQRRCRDFTRQLILARALGELGLKPSRIVARGRGTLTAACLSGLRDFGQVLAFLLGRPCPPPAAHDPAGTRLAITWVSDKRPQSRLRKFLGGIHPIPLKTWQKRSETEAADCLWVMSAKADASLALRRQGPGLLLHKGKGAAFWRGLCAVHVRGGTIRWERLFQDSSARHLTLPPQVWQGAQCWPRWLEPPQGQPSLQAERPPVPDQTATDSEAVTPPPAAFFTHKQIADRVRTVITQLLGLAGTEPDWEKPFAELGMNSLAAIDTAQMLSRELAVPLKAIQLFNYANLTALTAYLRQLRPHRNPTDREAVSSPLPAELPLQKHESNPKTLAGGNGSQADPSIKDLALMAEQLRSLIGEKLGALG